MKSKLLTSLLVLLVTAGALFAQNRVVGTVRDDIGPVIGASVMEKGTQNGAVTDLDGNYVITVKPGATLVFSSIGYATQEIEVGNQSTINVLLQEDTEFLDEVVVVNDAYLAEAWNTPEDFECSVCVPVASETTILGVVWFFANRKRRVGVRELETFNLIVGRLVGELEQESSRLGLATVENSSNAEKEQEILETTSENEFNDVIDSILAGIKS